MVQYTYWAWDGALSQEFCRAALEQIRWYHTPDQVNVVVDPILENVNEVVQSNMQPLGCVFQTYITNANQAAGWGYSLGGQEETKLLRQKGLEIAEEEWHMDAGPPQNGIQRKLSCVILLNDASEFEGGILQFKGMEDRNILTKQGSIVVFPSFIEHKVTPVTKGVRYTAVTWASGPSFR